jgi:site-specific recombinase XerD
MKYLISPPQLNCSHSPLFLGTSFIIVLTTEFEISITNLDIENMISEMECSAKRVNNILVPLRAVYKLAKKNKFVSENIMLDIDNQKIKKAQIRPLSTD